MITRKIILYDEPTVPEIQLKKLEEFTAENKLEKFIEFTGSVPYEKIGEYYFNADVFVHLSKTGSVDKVVLEAMASGIPVFSSSEAFKNIVFPQFLISGDPNELAYKIMNFTPISEDETSKLRDYVASNHSLKNLIERIIKEIEG